MIELILMEPRKQENVGSVARVIGKAMLTKREAFAVTGFLRKLKKG